jgi:hypothetical protein
MLNTPAMAASVVRFGGPVRRGRESRCMKEVPVMSGPAELIAERSHAGGQTNSVPAGLGTVKHRYTN